MTDARQKALEALDVLFSDKANAHMSYEELRSCYDNIRSALTNPWRTDMENAPRDGTRLLVCRSYFNEYVPQVGIDKFARLSSHPEGTWINSHSAGGPIAWMPLPPPHTDAKR